MNWINGYIKPSQIGYYMRDWNCNGDIAGIVPDYWNGQYWVNGKTVPRDAIHRCPYQNLNWRA